MADMRLSVIVGLVDRLTGPLKGVQAGLERLGASARRIGETLRNVGQRLVTFAAIGVAAMVKPVLAFAQAEDAATRLQLAMMRAGGVVPETYGEIMRLAEAMGDRLPGSTADFVKMMTMLQRQGLDTQTILAGTAEAAANLAVMFEMTPEGAAEFVAKLQDATGTLAKDMPKLADMIQRTFYLGVDPNNMLEAYANLAPGMSVIKAKGLEGAKAMAPLIAMMDQAKVEGSTAGIAISKVFTLPFLNTKAIADANKELKRFGVSALQFTKNGEWAGLDNMFAQFEKLAGLKTETRQGILSDIFGNDSQTLQAIEVLVTKGQAGYDEMLAKTQAQASITERINRLLGTLKNLWDAATGTFDNLMASLGELLAPEIKALTVWFGELSASIRQWVKDNPALAKTLALVTGGLVLAAAIAGGLALALSGAMLAFADLAPVIAAVLSPIGLLVTGAGALIALNWDRIKTGAAKAVHALVALDWGPVKRGAGAAMDALSGIGQALLSVGQVALRFGGGFLSGVWDGLKSGAPAIIAAFKPLEPLFTRIAGVVRDFIGWLGKLTGLSDAVGSAAEGMGQRWGVVVGGMIARLAELLGQFMSFGQRMAQVGMDWVSQLWDGFRTKWEEFRAWIAGLQIPVISSWVAPKIQAPAIQAAPSPGPATGTGAVGKPLAWTAPQFPAPAIPVAPSPGPATGTGAVGQPLSVVTSTSHRATVDGRVVVEIHDTRSRVRSVAATGPLAIDAAYVGRTMGIA